MKNRSGNIGMEGADFVYSFDTHYVFITDDIWSFNLIAKGQILELLAEKVKALK